MKHDYVGVLWHCDGCGREALLADPDELPLGYTGTARNGSDGSSWEWHACSARCLNKAIRNSEQRAGDPDSP